MRQWKGIVVHHSASMTGDAAEIDRWHKARGWKGVGYHFVVTREGALQLGRSLKMDGAHARGRNRTHIGICVIGMDAFLPIQNRALVQLLRTLCAVYAIPANMIERHHEQCPGLGMNLEAIATRAVAEPIVA